MRVDLIVTDVAHMRTGVCIAGYHLESLRCIRPVLGAGGGWPLDLLRDRKGRIVEPFSVIQLDLRDCASDPPHTEDCLLHQGGNLQVKGSLNADEARSFLRQTCDRAVTDVVGADIVDRRWVRPGAGTRSLGTIRARRLDFVALDYDEESSMQRYRILFKDGDDIQYRLPVTDLVFRGICDRLITKVGSRDATALRVKDRVNEMDEIYIRVGLSRPHLPAEIGAPPRCYLLVTGLYTFPRYFRGTWADYYPRGG